MEKCPKWGSILKRPFPSHSMFTSVPNDTQKAEGALCRVGGTPPFWVFCEKLSWDRFINKNFQMAQFLSMGLLVGQIWWLHTEKEPSQPETERARALWKKTKNDPKWGSKLWLLLWGPWGLWPKGPLWYFDTSEGGLSEHEWSLFRAQNPGPIYSLA